MFTMNKWTPTTDLMTLRRVGKTVEEMGELLSVLGRVIIQGINETDPGTGKVNRLRFEHETADVLAQLECNVRAFDLDAQAITDRQRHKESLMAEWEALFAGEPL